MEMTYDSHLYFLCYRRSEAGCFSFLIILLMILMFFLSMIQLSTWELSLEYKTE